MDKKIQLFLCLLWNQELYCYHTLLIFHDTELLFKMFLYQILRKFKLGRTDYKTHHINFCIISFS